MPKINPGFAALQPYLFSTLAAKAVAKGDGLLQLVSGNPDLPTPEVITEALARAATGYYPDPPSLGDDSLREAIAQYYVRQFGVEISAENIVVGHGTKTDLWDIGRVFSAEGDTFILPDPGYPIVKESSVFEGRIPHEVPFSKEHIWDLRCLDRSEFSLVYLCNPNNPNGAVQYKDTLSDIAARAVDANALLLSDIVYADFHLLSDKAAPSVFNAEDTDSVAVELGGFKAYSMTGFRVSWFATKNEEIAERWKRFKNNRDKGTPVPIQVAACEALTNKEARGAMAQRMDVYRKRAGALKKGLEGLGLEVHGLGHTPFAWVRVPQGCTSAGFAQRLLDECKLLVIPGTAFGSEGEGFVRLSIFADESQIEEAVSRISRAL